MPCPKIIIRSSKYHRFVDLCSCCMVDNFLSFVICWYPVRSIFVVFNLLLPQHFGFVQLHVLSGLLTSFQLRTKYSGSMPMPCFSLSVPTLAKHFRCKVAALWFRHYSISRPSFPACFVFPRLSDKIEQFFFCRKLALVGIIPIKFSSLSAPTLATKIEELTAGSDEKTQRSPAGNRTQGLANSSRTL